MPLIMLTEPILATIMFQRHHENAASAFHTCRPKFRFPIDVFQQALADVVDREQSGAVAAAESSRRDMEMKAKEESDLVHECQVCDNQSWPIF